LTFLLIIVQIINHPGVNLGIRGTATASGRGKNQLKRPANGRGKPTGVAKDISGRLFLKGGGKNTGRNDWSTVGRPKPGGKSFSALKVVRCLWPARLGKETDDGG
jgi:hypothetical protein